MAGGQGCAEGVEGKEKADSSGDQGKGVRERMAERWKAAFQGIATT